MFTLSSGSRNKLGELGLRLRKRTIVPRIPEQQDPEPRWVHLLSGTGRTIVRNPDSCDTCWAPTARTIIHFWQQVKARDPDTEQLFGLGTRLGRSPKSEQWLVSAGLMVARSPMNQASNPMPECLGKPEPESPRHPRK